LARSGRTSVFIIDSSGDGSTVREVEVRVVDDQSSQATSARRIEPATESISAPGGEISTDSGRFSVKPGGEFNAIDQLQSTIVANVEMSNSSNPVTLSDLGLAVRRGYEDPAAAGSGSQRLKSCLVDCKRIGFGNIAGVLG